MRSKMKNLQRSSQAHFLGAFPPDSFPPDRFALHFSRAWLKGELACVASVFVGSGSKERLRNGVFGVLLAGARDGARAKIRKRWVGDLIPWGTFQSREPRNQSLVLLPNEFFWRGARDTWRDEKLMVCHYYFARIWITNALFLYSYRVYALGRNT